jgi:ribose 1,5-bisphosphokinase
MNGLPGIQAANGPAPIAGGAFIAVVGPSGAGKDSVINYARERLADDAEVLFARRVITRAADAQSEDHDTLSEAEFSEAERRGEFALTWGAHGLRYGLPSSIDTAIADGKVVVANISRSVVAALEDRYVNFSLVMVSAHPDVIARRLASRGRENDDEIAKRLSRLQMEAPIRSDAIRLENSGPLEGAGERFVALLRGAVGASQ